MRISVCLVVGWIIVAGTLRAQELRDLDLTGWSCLDQLSGSAKTQDGIERNRMKNRSPVDLTGAKVEVLDTAGFLKRVRDYNTHLNSERRNQLSATERALLDEYEKQIVSPTGWLVLAYPGPPETTNCGDRDFHDWHLEVFEHPSDHPPRIGDPTPIICEIAPRTERQIYRDGIRLQSLAAFIRTGKAYPPTGHPAKQVRITGNLTWDDDHNGTADIGPKVENFSANGFHHPWRSIAWEIHPVMKIELLDQVGLDPAPGAAALTTPTPKESEAPTPMANPAVEFVTLLQPVTIKIPYGEAVLQPGQRLEVIGRDASVVRVRYLGAVYAIPSGAAR